MEVRPYVRTEPAPPGATAPSPTGRPALIELREDGVAALALSPEATAAGVILETFATALERDPDGPPGRARGRPDPARSTTSSPSSPAASGARASGSWCRPGVRLDRPFLVRWAVGTPVGRSSRGRSSGSARGRPRRSSRSSSASGPAIDCAEGEPVPQSFFGGTLEVVLEPGREPGGRLDPGPAGRGHRLPAPARHDRRRRRPSTGRSPSSADDSSGRGSTTGSRATARRSSRSRSCSARATRSST